MRKSKLYILALTTALIMPLSSCKETIIYVTPDDIPNDDIKTPIELSVGGVDGIAQSSATRASASAIITDGTSKTMETFKTNATIFMVMMSEYDTEHVDYNDPDSPHKKKFTVSRGDVTANSLDVVFDEKNIKYWDDAHARSSMISIWGFAQQGIPQRTGWLSGSFDIPNPNWDGTDPLNEYKQETYSTATTRYDWIKDTGKSKGEIYPCINVWKTSHNTDASVQDATSVLYQDLLFTNNIADNTVYSKRDGRLKFDFTNRKFPRKDDVWEGTEIKKTELKFYHAMSKITIKIKKGEGFTNSDPFAFASGTNVKISGMNTEGTFNIKEGEFQKINASYVITKIYQWTTPATGDAYTLEALAIPNIHTFMSSHSGSDEKSRFVSGKKNIATDVMMEFTIDNNKYQITSGQLYDALMQHDGDGQETTPVTNATKKTDNDTYIPLEAGKNYVFTFTIGKTKIKDITAQVAGWEEVAAEPINPSNARIKLQLEERGTAVTAPVDIYRAADNPSAVSDTWESYKWTTGYVGNKNLFDYIDTNNDGNKDTWKLTNDWFWDNNMTYYHFRAIMPTTTAVKTSDSKDYFEISSSSCLDADSYNAVAWGAPMLDVTNNDASDASTLKWNYGPTINGFDADDNNKVATGLPSSATHQIYKAIGPTEDPIKLILFHMMSGVHFTIKTTGSADANTDKVELFDGTNRTKVDLVGYYPDGKVLLGTGLVNADGTISTGSNPYSILFASAADNTHYVNQEYFFSAIPQSLVNVELVITTPDNNQYIVKLWDPEHPITATVTNTNIANPYKVSSTAGKYKIDRWYPGFKYNYSFTLAKTGITNLEATILDWETVEADNETVVIQ